MKSFTIQNNINFNLYKNVRFQEGLPKIKECKIKLGELAEVKVNFNDIKISDKAHMQYYYIFEGNILKEQLIIEVQSYLDTYTFPIEMISDYTDEESKNFKDKIITILPAYHIGRLPHARFSSIQKDGGEGLLFEYLHQSLYGKYDAGYERGVSKVYSDKGFSVGVWLMDDGYYMITEDILVGHKSISKKQISKEKHLMINDIIDVLKDFEGFYIVGEPRDNIFVNHLDIYKDTAKEVFKDWFKEDMSEEIESNINKIMYSKTFIDILILGNEFKKANDFAKVLEEKIKFEQKLSKWFEKWDYNKFLKEKYPDDYDYDYEEE